MFLDYSKNNETNESSSVFSFEDLKVFDDIVDDEETTQNYNDTESNFSFHAEDFAEWIHKHDGESSGKSTNNDIENPLGLEFLLQEDDNNNLDNESHFSFDAKDLTEWLEDEHQEQNDSITLNSSKYSSQISTINNNDNNLETMNLEKSTCTTSNKNDNNLSNVNLDKSCTSQVKIRDTFNLFQRLNSSKIRAELSRQKVLQCQVMASDMATHRRASYNIHTLKNRRFLFDIHESQKRLQSFSLQSNYRMNNGATTMLGNKKRSSVSESTVDGRQKRLCQLRNQVPNSNLALAA